MENIVNLKLNFDDKGLIDIQQKQIDLLKQSNSSVNEWSSTLKSAFDDAIKQMEVYNNAIKENINKLSLQDAELKKTTVASTVYNKAVDEIKSRLGEFYDVSVAATEALKKKAAAMYSAITSTTGLSKALGILKYAIIGTGIGALIVLLAGLVTAMNKLQTNVDYLSQAFRGFSSVADVFSGRLATIGNAFVKLVTGQQTLKQSLTEVGGAFNGVAKEMKNAYNEGVRIEKVYQDIENRARNLSVEQSSAEKRLAQLAAIYDKQGVSAGKAINAIKEASTVAVTATNKELELAKLKLQNIEDEIKLRGRLGTNTELEDKRAKALIEVNKLETDRINLTSDYQGRLDQIREQQRKEAEERQKQLEKLREEYQKLLGDLEKRLDKSAKFGLDGIEKLLVERDQAIKEIVNFQKAVEDAALKANIVLPEETKKQILSLFTAVEDEFVRQAAEYRKKNPFDLESILGIRDKIGKREFDKVAEAAAARLKIGLDKVVDTRSIFDKLKTNLLGAFKINENELSYITDLFGNTVGNINSVLLAGTQRQIKANEEEIQSIQNRIKVLQDAYAEEKRLQDEGYANNAANKEQAIKDEQKRLEKAQAQRQELQRKELRQQLIADSLQQASQLALGAAKIITAESSKGLIGIITAAAGISLLFSIIAKAKANAAKVSEPPKFKKGGQLLIGNSHEQGGIPVLIAGQRLVEAEGGEMIVAKDKTSKNLKLLKNLNDGRYDGVNLLSAAENARLGLENASRFKAMNFTGLTMQEKVDRFELQNQTRVLKLSIDDMKNELVSVVRDVVTEIKERPVVTPLAQGYKKEYKKGGTTTIEIYKPKNE